ncbi:MAG: inositol monophosphatase family protein, partial [Pseudomonadota bacterium]|nr:inositol monophosphatase family protein [Pseudomonadota bacterium]
MKTQADPDGVVSDEAVLSILREAAAGLILPRYRNLAETEVRTKTSATDFVTIADREAEAFITPALLALLPGSACIGEESVADGQTSISHIETRYIWTVDPIDGTRNFVAGSEHFCCMVSLIDRLEPMTSWKLVLWMRCAVLSLSKRSTVAARVVAAIGMKME